MKAKLLGKKIEVTSCDGKNLLQLQASSENSQTAQSKKMKPKFDPYLAVFNCHVNNAGERAMNVCRAIVGSEVIDTQLQDLEKDWKKGVMAIFRKEPTEISRLFVNSCFIFANGLDKQ